MCKRCFDLWNGMKDVERPCRRSGCKGTWMDKRGAQLARAVRGKTGDPYPHLCSTCEKELGDLEDREIPCRTDHCPGTFTWSKEQQLAAGVRPKLKDVEVVDPDAAAPEIAAQDESGAGIPTPMEAPPAAGDTQSSTHETAPAASASPPEVGRGKRNKRKRKREVQPPVRRCSACSEFLANRKTQEIPCSQCGTPIFWPPESQLQTHLGNWAAPSLCGACKLIQVQAAREVARELLRHPHAQQPATPEPPAAAAATPAVEPPAEH
jgi:DNA-directed RNA polymerase subunit RPC12/RpoP